MNPNLDDLTQLTAYICKSPIVLLSLIKNDSYYCKSSFGISRDDIDLQGITRTSAIAENETYNCTLNIREDKRFNTLSLLKTFPQLTSYHSYNLKTTSGDNFGILALFSNENKELSLEQIDSLRLLSKQIASVIELSHTNRLLKNYKKQLKKTSKKADDFASMAAHDLKTPIRNVKSFLGLIKPKHEYSKKEDLYFDLIDTSIIRMNMLIEGLMHYSKAKVNHKHTEPVDLNALVEDSFKDLIASLNLNTVSLRKEQLPIINSHKVALSVVFENLMSNAIKYQKGDDIEISVSYELEDDFHCLVIADNGIGIDNEYVKEIFKPFKRLHTQSEFIGSGLGLATCKKIIKNLKGSLSVKSKLGQGSEFTIKLPIVKKP